MKLAGREIKIKCAYLVGDCIVVGFEWQTERNVSTDFEGKPYSIEPRVVRDMLYSTAEKWSVRFDYEQTSINSKYVEMCQELYKITREENFLRDHRELE